MEEHLIFKIIAWAMKAGFFSYNQLNDHFKFGEHEQRYVQNTLIDFNNPKTSNPNNIIALVVTGTDETGQPNKKSNFTLTLLPNAIVSYNEYLEIVHARRNSEQAKKQARIATNISIISIIISIAIGAMQIYYQVKSEFKSEPPKIETDL